MTIRQGVLWLVAALVFQAACASSGALKAARQAEIQNDFDRAVVEYTKALREDPDDAGIRAALERSKLRAATDHFTRGRRLGSLGRYEQALVEYQLAAELNPASSEIDDALRETRARLRTKINVNRDGKTELETLIDETRSVPSPGLDLPSTDLPDSLIFRDASSRDVFITLARIAGLNVAFDPAFREAPVSIELRGVTLDEALTAVTASTRTFYRVTAARTVTIVPDTPAKRREYEEEIIRTFYLSNADLKETIDLLRIVVDNRRISPITGTNAITIKDTPERITAAAKVISAVDKARAEVIIDVEVLEVDRTRLKEYGLQIASPGSPPIGIDGSVDINRDNFTLRDLTNLTQADVFLSNLPGALLPPAQERHQHPRAGESPAPHVRGPGGAGAVWRPRPGTGHDLRADCHRRRQPAADHVVQLREHRRQHRHHAAHPLQRRCVAQPEDRGQQHLRRGLWRAADIRQPRHQFDHPAARRRDEHAGRSDPGRGADGAQRRPRPERSPGDRPDLRREPQGNEGERHHPRR